ncbi:hypothetical protein Nepgr_006779 [Nepenthes gracilis]|uniref:Uncharacterized protein n=1 Tax=Nepenthes gracilis TaxID=150966 RepID=A0AAD3S5P7_NEPGR|nr:hypothetical protein Nepgr_006779 [Nepenthes gracilis]
MQLICCSGRLLGRFFAGFLVAVVMVLPPCFLNLVQGNQVRLVAEVDWPLLFEFCGVGAAYWRVVEVTSLLQLTKVLKANSGLLIVAYEVALSCIVLLTAAMQNRCICRAEVAKPAGADVTVLVACIC